jgi:hypothetical protein
MQSGAAGRDLHDTADILAECLGHGSLDELEEYISSDCMLYEESNKSDSAINWVLPEVDF